MKAIIAPSSNAGIYAIVNTVNNKRYIGSTKNIKSRFKQHVSSLKSNTHFNQHLQHSFNKYGESHFKFIILEYCNIDNLIQKEQKWIDFCFFTENYNMATYAHGGRCMNCPTGVEGLYVEYQGSRCFFRFKINNIFYNGKTLEELYKKIPTKFNVVDYRLFHLTYYTVNKYNKKCEMKSNRCGVKHIVICKNTIKKKDYYCYRYIHHGINISSVNFPRLIQRIKDEYPMVRLEITNPFLYHHFLTVETDFLT